MKIALAGIGGIGSNVAVNLVRNGIGFLKIVDFDRVEPGNLNRQFYFHDQIGRLKVEALTENLQRIRPQLLVEALAVRIDAGNCREIFDDCDLVVEGFDRQADKKMLFELLGNSRPVIGACGIAGSDLDRIKVRRLGQCCIVGDFATDCSTARLFMHKVATIANFMSQIILQKSSCHA